jgi:hypothetical protein
MEAEMNATQWIFAVIGCFAIGYIIGAFFKNIGKVYDHLGIILSVLIIPFLVMYVLAGAEIVLNYNSAILSIVFAIGFIIRMVKPR